MDHPKIPNKHPSEFFDSKIYITSKLIKYKMWFKKKRPEKTIANQEKTLPKPNISPPPTPDLPKLPSLPHAQPIPTSRPIHQPHISTQEDPEKFAPSIMSEPQKANNQFQQTEPHLQTPTISAPPQTLTKETEPIFVKIDKFQTAKNSFEKIKEKVTDIESMLIQVRDLKSKEEQELSNWQQELQLIKTKIQTIDDSLFSKVD